LAPFDARYGHQLLPALDGVADARARVEGLAVQLARREAELADDQAEAARLTAAIADLPGLETALKRAEAAVEGAAATERRARLEEGAALQQIGALAALEERRKLLATDLDRVNEEISVFNQLREAFGKKGLQAMIIESAIPEVEIEANRLLARMSDNRMSLRLETQREKVTGGVAETLDIIISDELGARAYETFSGGESFRANLALRIAISKLLARRAGAQLQTLVIDEGFGSQDSQGRSLVVEAINSIQHDFERIIVITHIEELKDLFPAYDGRGYELAGFGWHQGWNDRINDKFNAEYESNMTHFIRDVRKDLDAPALPFVIAETGMNGPEETHPRALSLMKAQAAVAEHKEFKGNVAFVSTRAFWRPKEWSPSGQGYHWNSNAETYYLIGEAMGEAMKRLLGAK